jgi:DNA-binding transcriptional LysR family regulator
MKQNKKMAKVVQHINEQAPNLHLVIDCDFIANIDKLPLKDKAHIGLFSHKKPVQDLHYQTLLSELSYLCCAKTYPFFAILDHQILAHAFHQALAILPGIDVDINAREALSKLNLVVKAYQFDTRKPMILYGKYIGYLPKSNIQNALNKGEMRMIKPSELTYPFDLSMVHKKANKYLLLAKTQ